MPRKKEQAFIEQPFRLVIPGTKGAVVEVLVRVPTQYADKVRWDSAHNALSISTGERVPAQTQAYVASPTEDTPEVAEARAKLEALHPKAKPYTSEDAARAAGLSPDIVSFENLAGIAAALGDTDA